MDQKKKNIALFVSLVLLVLVSALLSFSSNDVPNEIDPDLFRLPDSRSVDKVVIKQPSNDIVLQFKSGRWMVNESYEADRDLITLLFATVDQARARRKVAASIADSIQSAIEKSGIRVSFFLTESLQKEFHVFGDDQSGTSYFQDTQVDVPYVMMIPGYHVFIAGLFQQETNYWRDKRIFNFNWRNFKSLTAEFPNDPAQSFTVAMEVKFFSISGETRSDTAMLNSYLDAVSLIRADQFYEKGADSRWDSLSESKPIMKLIVDDVTDHQYSLSVFGIGQGEPNALALWNNDYVWFDRRNILAIYKKKKDFIK